MSEADLGHALEAARRGEEPGMATLYRALNPGLLRYLLRKAPGMAEDLASEAWFAAAQRLANFEGGLSEFRALLYSIAHRRVADHYRGVERRPTMAHGVEAEPADPADVEAQALGSIAANEAIRRLVDSLPPAQAEVVLLRVVGDLSVTETAQVMGRSPVGVRVLQHRALRRLAADLAREI